LRNRIQAAIGRRFYQRKYDAREALEKFVARLQAENDTMALAADLDKRDLRYLSVSA